MGFVELSITGGGLGWKMVDVDKDLELRDRIQSIALEWSVYGYRRILAELRRQGIVVNHKRVLRLMREDNILCLRKKSFIRTTDSIHSHRLNVQISYVERVFLD